MQELKIKFDNIDHIQLIGGTVRKTAAAVFAELKEKPDYLINAGMYDMTSGLTVCDTIVEGSLLNGGNYTNKGFAWNDKKSALAPMTTDMARDNGCPVSYTHLDVYKRQVCNQLLSRSSKFEAEAEHTQEGILKGADYTAEAVSYTHLQCRRHLQPSGFRLK